MVEIERIIFFEAGLWDRVSEKLVAKYGPANKSLSMSNWLVWNDRGGDNCLLRQSGSRHQWHVAGVMDQGRRPDDGLETPLELLVTRLYDPSVLARLLRDHAARPPSADALPMKF